MNTHLTLAWRSACVFIAATVLLSAAGCKKESSPESGDAQAQPRAPRAASKPALQAELEGLRQIPVERSPERRPLVISQRAATQRDWALGALRQGYFQTGCTNSKWDAQALEAFEAYSDYSRGRKAERFGAITNAVTQVLQTGCEDGMLQYMHARYCVGEHNDTQEKYAIALVKVSRALTASKHHPAFKHLSAWRAIVAARERPGLWGDVRSAYERFFELNPSEIGWRHDYASDAYLCGEYGAFLAQTRLFSSGTNHTFFGGEAKFQQMLRKAAARSAR